MRLRASAAGTGRVLSTLAIAGALTLALAACGGGAAAAPAETAAVAQAPAEEVEAAPSTASEAAAVADTPDAPEAAPDASVEVGQTVWFAGFRVTFGTATAELDEDGSGPVTIDAVFENLGDDAARLDATLTLVSGGETALEGIGGSVPSVPGGGSEEGTLAFHARGSFSFDDAVLTLGRPGIQQAVVPLTPSAGEVVTQEPFDVAASGSATAGVLRLDLEGGEIRADKPWTHGQLPEGTLLLTLRYSASYEGDSAGGFPFAGENVALRLPDGTTVGIVHDGHSQTIELIGAGTTVGDQYSRFEIPDPVAGEYALLVRTGGEENEIPFSIP